MMIIIWIFIVSVLLFTAQLIFIGLLLADYYRNHAIWTGKPITIDYVGQEELGPYYLCMLHKLDDSGRLVNENGAVVVRDISGRQWLHPVGTAHRAFAFYERYLNKHDCNDLLTFETIAKELIARADVQADGTTCWPYWIAGKLNQKLPWFSAMAQGQVIGVLCRAFQETESRLFLDAAMNAFKAFCKDIKDGGVRSNDPLRGVFFEEYAYHEEGSHNHTLNGMIAALFGIYDLSKITGDAVVRDVFDTGVATIKRNLLSYHFPFCSAYDLRHKKGLMASFNPHYNSVHVSHLRVLSIMTGDGYFAGIADLWDTTLRDPCNRLRLMLWYLRWQKVEGMRLIREFGFFPTMSDALRRLVRRFG